jgi:hypothetical protein
MKKIARTESGIEIDIFIKPNLNEDPTLDAIATVGKVSTRCKIENFNKVSLRKKQVKELLNIDAPVDVVKVMLTEAIDKREIEEYTEKYIRENGIEISYYIDGEWGIPLFNAFCCGGEPVKMLTLEKAFPNIKCWDIIKENEMNKVRSTSTEAGRVVVNFSEYTEINADTIAKMEMNKATVEELKFKSLFNKAKETGTKQELKRFYENCNGEVDECSTDIIVTYAMPDGSTSTERIHCH